MSSSDIQAFVNRLVETEPAATKSIRLEIDTNNDTHALFEVLLMIMIELLKKWYSPPITITTIRPEHLIKLQKYFASFGIEFYLVVHDHPSVIRIHNKDYLQKTKLEDMKFKMYDRENDQLFSVHFLCI